jgi:carboxymethylenebutenolidase
LGDIGSAGAACVLCEASIAGVRIDEGKETRMPLTQPEGHLAIPAKEIGRGVLVLHAWWGLNETLKAFCQRLAESGFVAFAPDLYRGQVADTIPGAEDLSNTLDAGQAKADVLHAATFLHERASQETGSGLAVIGFSLGAYFALDLSNIDPEHIRSVVVFYGTGPGDFSKSRASYLGHFAETDEFEPRSEVDKLEASLRRAGRPVSFHHYNGTRHWFFEPDRPQFDEAAARLAWERTLAFLEHSSTE